jgi:hypothetical protein
MLPVLVPMAPSSTITVEDRTEARTRSTAGSNAGDVETDPSLKYSALWGEGHDGFVLAYTPRILYTDFTGHAHDFEMLNGGVAGLTILHKRTTFQVNTFDQYGTILASSLVIPTRWKGEGAPAIIYSLPAAQSAKLTYLASYSSASLVQALTPRLNLTVNAQMGVFGGLDEQSRVNLPLVYGPNGELKLEYRVTKHDEVAVTGGVHYAHTQVAASVPLVETTTTLANGNVVTAGGSVPAIQPKAAIVGYAELRYRHHWSKKTYTEVAGGVAVASQDFPTEYQVGPYVGRAGTIPYPTGELLTVYNPVDPDDRPRNKIQAVFDAKIEPWFSPFGGINEERVELAGAINFLFGKNTIRIQGGFYNVLPTGSSSVIAGDTQAPRPADGSAPPELDTAGTPGKYTFAMGEIVWERKLNKYLTLDGGGRAFRQIFHDIGLSTAAGSTPGTTTTQVQAYSGDLIEYVGFLGFSWSTPPAKF